MQDTIAAYDTAAERFADRWFDLRLEENMARFAGRLGPGARVLDVGCGPGRDAAWLVERGYDAGGVDLSLGMLREGRARGVTVPLFQADMRHLPFRKGSFQGLWVCASLLHIPKQQAGEVLVELGRIVYPGHIYLAVKRGEGEEWVEDECWIPTGEGYICPDCNSYHMRNLVTHRRDLAQDEGPDEDVDLEVGIDVP